MLEIGMHGILIPAHPYAGIIRIRSEGIISATTIRIGHPLTYAL